MMISNDRKEEVHHNQYFLTINTPEVKDALHDVEAATVKKESISRKLAAGSNAVTVQDLTVWDTAFTNAKAALLELTKKHPILINHHFLHGYVIPA